MNRAFAAPASVAFLLALSVFAGCKAKTPNEQLTCESNLDCTSPGTRCDDGTKRCVCATDEACADGQFCNRAGVCQEFAGCVSNADCTRKTGSYCDIASGQCLMGPALMINSPCGLASHCPYGTLCREGSCVPACYDDGDCPLGQVCLNDQCVTGTDICGSDDFCGYGQYCDPDTSPGLCKNDHRGPFCHGCSFRHEPENPEPCNDPRNFCLINNFETGGFRTFCGVDCSLGQSCPNGYECGNVIILTQNVCGAQADCRCSGPIRLTTTTCTVSAACDPRMPNGQPDPNVSACRVTGEAECMRGVETSSAACQVPRGARVGQCECSTSADCPDNGICVDGLCCGAVEHPDRNCVGDENRVSGFCTCSTDMDCPRDVCDSGRRACAITGLPCEPGSGDCGPIPCINGGCLIGANCAPLQGLSCSLVAPHD